MDINANMPPLPDKWCIKGSIEFSLLLAHSANVKGDNENYYYFNRDNNDISKCLTNRTWGFAYNIPDTYIEIDIELLKYHIDNFTAEEIKAISNSILPILTKLRIE